jgi:exonuclease SbcC
VTGKMLEELCTDLKRQVKNCQRDLAKTDKEYHTIAGKLGRFKSVKEAENNLEKAAKKLTEIEERLTESRKLLDTEEGRKEEREKLSREITIKKDKLEEFDKLDELTEEVNSRQKQLQKLNEKVKEEEKEIAALQKKIMQGQEKIEQLGNAQENSLHLEQEKERLAQLAEQCREYEEDAKELDKLEKQQSRQREQYQRAAKEADESMQLALQLERAFLDGQAGILAAGLQNGKPCPVCGAVEHPNPAVFHNYIPVQEEVETAKNKAEEERTKAAELSEKIKEMEGRRTVLKQKKEICEEKLLRIWKETTGEMLELQQDTIALAQAKLAERRMQNEKNLEQTARQRQELETLKKQLPMMQQQFTEEQTRVQVDREQAVREQEGLLSLQTRREQWKEQLGFAGKKEAMQYIKRREKELSQMEAAYQKAKQDVDKETGKKKETEAEIRTLTAMVEKQKKEVGEENEERLLAEEKRLNQEKQQFSQAQEEAAMMAAEDERITQNVCRQLKKLEETDEKWQMVKSLYNTAAGNISGKDKIMLETYVQMAYFDRIINRANVHFMKMTDGRFELLRSREAGNQKSQSGLELNVLDHYYMSRNNGSRSVKSLSGGESFLAALSLALGMSEEVSANAGGIEMDAMFVDEGFGTLDESALERAVRALQELSTASRIVGIISHVPELKNRIERQIVVKKEKLKGSSTEMIS